MSGCRHMAEGRCSNADALPTFGPKPHANACRICSFYDGPPRGLGDCVHSIAEATGIARIVKAVAGDDCGCAQRRAALNAAVPLVDPSRETP